MDTGYWIKEYILVLIAYGVVMFVWPEIVFRKWLCGRSLTVRVCFDSMFMIFAINAYVLILGLIQIPIDNAGGEIKILNPWMIRIGFWGGLLASITIPFVKENGKHTLKRFFALLTGGYGVKSLGRNVVNGIKNTATKIRKKVNSRLYGHFVLYTLLAFAVIYGIVYYSAGVFETPTYGFSDLYVHHKWIYEMCEGKIFPHGIYPEGMHTFIYLIHTCFGISLYSIILYLQVINVGLFLLAIFLLGKEAYNWRYSAVIALVFFLILGYGVTNAVATFSRLQCSLPMEFGAAATLLCPVFLLRYLKDIRLKSNTVGTKKIYKDENLVVFGLALYATISIHYYCTIIAFFLCLAIVPFYFREVFYFKNFCRLVFSVILSTVLSVVPMLIALALGKKFQGSIGWALNVISGNNNSSSSTAGSGSASGGVENARSFWEKLTELPETVIERVYNACFDSNITYIFLGATIVSIVVLVILSIVFQARSRAAKKQGEENKVALNLASLYALIMMAVAIMIMRKPGVFGLPQLVEGSRMIYYATLCNIFVLLIPFDLVCAAINCRLKNKGDGIIAIILSVACVVIVVVTGNFHGSLYFEVTRYNGAANATAKIIEENEENTFTIVSPVDDTWHVAECGRHTELIEFLVGSITRSYTIPTEKIYIFVEKHPLHYRQYHFPKVFSWVADGEQSQNLLSFSELVTTGKGQAIKYDLKYDEETITNVVYPNDSRYYKNARNRVVLESKMMLWVKSFDLLYPRSLKVYYEDDDMVCYVIDQNVNSPYQLAIKWKNSEVADGEYNDPSLVIPGDSTGDETGNHPNEAGAILDYVYDEATNQLFMRFYDAETGELIEEYIISDFETNPN